MGVEPESGDTFLVPVRDRTADTLMTIIRDWIEPGTTVISDLWAASRDLGAQGYTHDNHSIQFVNPHTGAHKHNREHVAQRKDLSRTIQPQGMTTNFILCTICSR